MRRGDGEEAGDGGFFPKSGGEMNPPDMASREEMVFLAKLAGKSSRFHEMWHQMKGVAMMNKDLTVEERSLLSVAYENLVHPRRASLRRLVSFELKEVKRNESNLNKIQVYRHKVEVELSTICFNVIEVVDGHLIPCASCRVNLIFYYKMKGDCYQYLAELKLGCEKEASKQAFQAYKIAFKAAEKYLPVTDPIRLALALNIAVFFDEILNWRDRALEVAEGAFDKAASVLESTNQQPCSGLTKIAMQLLKDKLANWGSHFADHAGLKICSAKLTRCNSDIVCHGGFEVESDRVEVSEKLIEQNSTPTPSSLSPGCVLDEHSNEVVDNVSGRSSDEGEAVVQTHSDMSDDEVEDDYREAMKMGRFVVRRLVVRTGGRRDDLTGY